MEEDHNIEIVPEIRLPFLLALKADEKMFRKHCEKIAANINLTAEQVAEVSDCLLELLLNMARSN